MGVPAPATGHPGAPAWTRAQRYDAPAPAPAYPRGIRFLEEL